MYKNFRVGERMQEYNGVSEAVTLSRSVQRLALSKTDNYDHVYYSYQPFLQLTK